MITLASGLSYFDLEFERRPRIIATAVVHGSGGVALVDPGPSSTLPTLRATLGAAGISMRDVTTILLTHIHLDHAGATGTPVRQHPGLRVFVHAKARRIRTREAAGQCHAVDGDAMDRLGRGAAGSADAMTVLAAERITAGDRSFDVEHAGARLAPRQFFDRDSGVALVGDTAGVKLVPDGYVMPPTPPPDVDLESWRDSLARIERWRPDTLFLTHFGPSPFAGHLSALGDHLGLVSDLAKTSLAREGTDEDREAWFADQVRLELARRMNHPDTRAYELADRFDLNWRGLARYWRKKNSR